MNTQATQAPKPVIFVLDGIPFTGTLLKLYTLGGGQIKAAVQVDGYAINGTYFKAEPDGSAVQVDATALVEVTE